MKWHDGRSAYERTPWWVSAIFPVFALVAAYEWFRTTARLSGSERKASRIFGIGCSSLFAADLMWGIYDSFLGIAVPTSVLRKAFYTGFPIFFIFGVWYYRIQTPSTDDAFIQTGNLGIIFSATLIMFTFANVAFLGNPIPTYPANISIFHGTIGISAALLALDETREHVFDPFFTTRRDEGGTWGRAWWPTAAWNNTAGRYRSTPIRVREQPSL